MLIETRLNDCYYDIITVTFAHGQKLLCHGFCYLRLVRSQYTKSNITQPVGIV